MKAKQEVFAYFIQSRSSAIYEVDIHPKAEIGTRGDVGSCNWNCHWRDFGS